MAKSKAVLGKGAIALKKGQILNLKDGELLAMLQSPDRVIKLKDGWVKDRMLGRDWGPLAKSELSQPDGRKHCQEFKNGDLPSEFELYTLYLLLKNKDVQEKFFPDHKPGWYWSGTDYPGYSGCAYIVDFRSGRVSNDLKDNWNYVRPVRSSQ